MTAELLIAIALLCQTSKYPVHCQLELIDCVDVGAGFDSAANRVSNCVKKGATK